jgi:hypothetical protein
VVFHYMLTRSYADYNITTAAVSAVHGFANQEISLGSTTLHTRDEGQPPVESMSKCHGQTHVICIGQNYGLPNSGLIRDMRHDFSFHYVSLIA